MESDGKSTIDKLVAEGNVAGLENIAKSPESDKDIRVLAAEALTSLRTMGETITEPVSTTPSETERVANLGGSNEELTNKTKPIDAKIADVSKKATETISKATESIENVTSQEVVTKQLEGKKGELDKVNREIEENEEEARKMELYIKIAEGFLDLNLPKETVISLLEKSGAKKETIDTIMKALRQDVDEQKEVLPISENLRKKLDAEVSRRGLFATNGSGNIDTYEKFLKVKDQLNYPGLEEDLDKIIKANGTETSETDENVEDKKEGFEMIELQVFQLLSAAIENNLSDDPELKSSIIKLLPEMMGSFKEEYEKSNKEEREKFVEQLKNFCNDKEEFTKNMKEFREVIGAENVEGGSNTTETPLFTPPNHVPPIDNNPINPDDYRGARGVNTSGAFMMPTNRKFFEKMSDRGRAIASALYKGINAVPLVNRMVAKVGIAYNQRFIDKKERRSVKLKDKMDGLDLNIRTFEQSKSRMIGIMENLRGTGNPGAAAIALEIKKLEKQEIAMANKRDKLQSKVEKKENKIKIFVGKRDKIADRMIANYERKLSPIEGKLGLMHDQRDQMDLFILGRETELEQDQAYFNDLNTQKEEIMRSLMSTGQSAEKAGRSAAIRSLEKQIEKGSKRIEKAKNELNAKREEVNVKIAKVDAKAQPFRDRRDKFIRVKEGRPIDLNLKRRQALFNRHIVESTNVNTREEAEDVPNTPPTNAGESSFNTGPSYMERTPQISELVSNYNEYLTQRGARVNLRIDPQFLLNAVRLSRESRVTPAKFKEIVKGYYKVKKIPESDYTTLLNNLI